jgi:hypothetical protein
MSQIVSRLDITQIFWDVDEFCEQVIAHWQHQPHLPSQLREHSCRSRLHLSEGMTIVIAFHDSGYCTFKDFYTLCALPRWRRAFPHLVSYTHFVELIPWCLLLLCCFLHTRKGKVTGIAFIDSTPIEVCHPCRAHAHRVFDVLVHTGAKTRWVGSTALSCI